MHAIRLVMKVEPCARIHWHSITTAVSPDKNVLCHTPGLLAVILFIHGNRHRVSVWRGATIGKGTREVSLQNVAKKLMPQPVWNSHWNAFPRCLWILCGVGNLRG